MKRVFFTILVSGIAFLSHAQKKSDTKHPKKVKTSAATTVAKQPEEKTIFTPPVITKNPYRKAKAAKAHS